jgi:hypothetical protein
MMRLRAFIPCIRKAKNSLSQIFTDGGKTRGSYSRTFLTELIDPATAGRRLSISNSTLEYLADACMITHYEIDGEIRFDPSDLNRWLQRHKIDEVDKGLMEWLTDCAEGREQL